MNKVELRFLISHIKKAIFNLECANKFKEGSVDTKVIEELKLVLFEHQLKLKEEEETCD